MTDPGGPRMGASKIVTRAEAARRAEEWRAGHHKIVFTNGVPRVGGGLVPWTANRPAPRRPATAATEPTIPASAPAVSRRSCRHDSRISSAHTRA